MLFPCWSSLSEVIDHGAQPVASPKHHGSLMALPTPSTRTLSGLLPLSTCLSVLPLSTPSQYLPLSTPAFLWHTPHLHAVHEFCFQQSSQKGQKDPFINSAMSRCNQHFSLKIVSFSRCINPPLKWSFQTASQIKAFQWHPYLSTQQSGATMVELPYCMWTPLTSPTEWGSHLATHQPLPFLPFLGYVVHTPAPGSSYLASSQTLCV